MANQKNIVIFICMLVSTISPKIKVFICVICFPPWFSSLCFVQKDISLYQKNYAILSNKSPFNCLHLIFVYPGGEGGEESRLERGEGSGKFGKKGGGVGWGWEGGEGGGDL